LNGLLGAAFQELFEDHGIIMQLILGCIDKRYSTLAGNRL